MTPVEELRAAATLLRGTAQTGPWLWTVDGTGTQVYDKAAGMPFGGFVADCRNPAVAAWIALASPALAEPLAAWLETCANDFADARHYIDEPNSCEHALAVARAINGSTS